uniref:Uncharacterized protein n=1 Tax=Panagrolaimus sp. JU765 TaxID=591449 RepID=A0AC34RJ37_9BILA
MMNDEKFQLRKIIKTQELVNLKLNQSANLLDEVEINAINGLIYKLDSVLLPNHAREMTGLTCLRIALLVNAVLGVFI